MESELHHWLGYIIMLFIIDRTYTTAYFTEWLLNQRSQVFIKTVEMLMNYQDYSDNLKLALFHVSSMQITSLIKLNHPSNDK